MKKAPVLFCTGYKKPKGNESVKIFFLHVNGFSLGNEDIIYSKKRPLHATESNWRYFGTYFDKEKTRNVKRQGVDVVYQPLLFARVPKIV